MAHRITIRREMSKTRKPYFTFSNTSTITYILTCLNGKLVQGKPLHENSPVMASDYKYKTNRGQNREKVFLTTMQIGK